MSNKMTIHIESNLNIHILENPKYLPLSILVYFLIDLKKNIDLIYEVLKDANLSGGGSEVFSLIKEHTDVIIEADYDQDPGDKSKLFVTSIEDMIRIIEEWKKIAENPKNQIVTFYQETKNSPVQIHARPK